MQGRDKEQDRVVYRGPVSGTGEALSDEDALKILDERIDSGKGDLPDIGVVIERSEVKSAPARGQQSLAFADEIERLHETFLRGELYHHHEKPPPSITWAQLPWSEGCVLCEQSKSHPIVKAGLGTKLPLLIDTSYRNLPRKGLGPSHHSPVRLRLMFGDAIYDVSVEPKDLDQPNLTVRDLLTRATGLNYE